MGLHCSQDRRRGVGRTGSGRELSVEREYKKWRGREYGGERERASPGDARREARMRRGAPPCRGCGRSAGGAGGTWARMGEGRLGPWPCSGRLATARSPGGAVGRGGSAVRLRVPPAGRGSGSCEARVNRACAGSSGAAPAGSVALRVAFSSLLLSPRQDVSLGQKRDRKW